MTCGVLDANGVIGLAKAGCLQQAATLFQPAYIPATVALEITDATSKPELETALRAWLVEAVPSLGALVEVGGVPDRPDDAVIALAWEQRPCIIVTGDRALANRALRLGLDAISAPRVVQVLADCQAIPAVRPYLDRMLQHGFGIPHQVYETILREVGEL